MRWRRRGWKGEGEEERERKVERGSGKVYDAQQIEQIEKERWKGEEMGQIAIVSDRKRGETT